MLGKNLGKWSAQCDQQNWTSIGSVNSVDGSLKGTKKKKKKKTVQAVALVQKGVLRLDCFGTTVCFCPDVVLNWCRPQACSIAVIHDSWCLARKLWARSTEVEVVQDRSEGRAIKKKKKKIKEIQYWSNMIVLTDTFMCWRNQENQDTRQTFNSKYGLKLIRFWKVSPKDESL